MFCLGKAWSAWLAWLGEGEQVSRRTLPPNRITPAERVPFRYQCFAPARNDDDNGRFGLLFWAPSNGECSSSDTNLLFICDKTLPYVIHTILLQKDAKKKIYSERTINLNLLIEIDSAILLISIN